MTAARTIASDQLLASGGPVMAARQSFDAAFAPRHDPVTHSYAALAFYVGGQASMELSGRAWHLRRGDVLLLPAGLPHRHLDAQSAELWGLAICVPCFAAHDDAALFASFEAVRDGRAPVVSIPEGRHDFLVSLFRELGDDARSLSGVRQQHVQRSLLTLIVAEVAEASSMDGLPSGTGGGVVVDALRFIERHCLEKLTPADVAAAVGRSPAYVTTALSRATGRSAGAWIVAGKMAEARRLLLRSDEMVDVIAERVGYADPTHFIRMFRRSHGLTPAAWRAANAHR